MAILRELRLVIRTRLLTVGSLAGLVAALRVLAVLLKLPGEVGEFGLRELERLRLVTEHGIGGALDAAAELVEILRNPRLRRARAVIEAAPEQFRTVAQVVARVGEILGLRAEQVVELVVEHGLGGLAGVSDVAEVVHQILKIAPLLFEALHQRLTLPGVVEATRPSGAGLGDLLLELLLALGQVAGLLPGLAHLLGKLAGRLTLEIVARLVELLLRTRAGGERLLHVALLKLLVSALHILSSLLELLAGLLPLLGLLGGLIALRLGVGLQVVEPVPGLVEVGEHLALFLFEALQLAADLLALLLVTRGVESGLQFL